MICYSVIFFLIFAQFRAEADIAQPSLLCQQKFREDVQCRWKKFRYWDLQRKRVGSHLFHFTCMDHIRKSVSRGDATVLDGERFLEQALRDGRPSRRMFKQLLEVVTAAARRGAVHGADLTTIDDGERVVQWMRAEGLPVGSGVYARLLHAAAWLAVRGHAGIAYGEAILHRMCAGCTPPDRRHLEAFARIAAASALHAASAPVGGDCAPGFGDGAARVLALCETHGVALTSRILDLCLEALSYDADRLRHRPPPPPPPLPPPPPAVDSSTPAHASSLLVHRTNQSHGDEKGRRGGGDSTPADARLAAARLAHAAVEILRLSRRAGAPAALPVCHAVLQIVADAAAVDAAAGGGGVRALALCREVSARPECASVSVRAHERLRGQRCF
jgi:hypothetical protein